LSRKSTKYKKKEKGPGNLSIASVCRNHLLKMKVLFDIAFKMTPIFKGALLCAQSGRMQYAPTQVMLCHLECIFELGADLEQGHFLSQPFYLTK
jgi:hypothetical protein